jgi:hypothetical protein
MTQFIANYWKDLIAHAPYAPTQKQEFRAWSKQFAKWLFSTEHISIRYEIAYDGVDIRKLSPGTRASSCYSSILRLMTPMIVP